MPLNEMKNEMENNQEMLESIVNFLNSVHFIYSHPYLKESYQKFYDGWNLFEKNGRFTILWVSNFVDYADLLKETCRQVRETFLPVAVNAGFTPSVIELFQKNLKEVAPGEYCLELDPTLLEILYSLSQRHFSPLYREKQIARDKEESKACLTQLPEVCSQIPPGVNQICADYLYSENLNPVARKGTLYFFTVGSWFNSIHNDPRGITQEDMNQLVLKNFRAIWDRGDIIVLFSQYNNEKTYKEDILVKAGFTHEEISKLIIKTTSIMGAPQEFTQHAMLYLRSLVVLHPQIKCFKYYDAFHAQRIIDKNLCEPLGRVGQLLSQMHYNNRDFPYPYENYYDCFSTMLGSPALTALRSMIPLRMEALTPRHCYQTPVTTALNPFEPMEEYYEGKLARYRLDFPLDLTYQCLKDHRFRVPEKYFKQFDLEGELKAICPEMDVRIRTFKGGCFQLFIHNPSALQKLLEQKPNALESVKKSWEEAIECRVALFDYVKNHPMVLKEYKPFTMDKLPAYFLDKQQRTSDYGVISERLADLLRALTLLDRVEFVNKFLADTVENMEILFPLITSYGLIFQCHLGILYCQQAKNYYLKTQDKQGTIRLLNKARANLAGVSTYRDNAQMNYYEGIAAIHLGGIFLCLARLTHDVEQAANYQGKAREAFENALKKYPMFNKKSRQFIQEIVRELGGSIVGVMDDAVEDKENSVSKLESELKSIRDPDEFIGELIKDSFTYNGPFNAHHTYLCRVILHHPKGKEFIVAQLKERSNKDHTGELNQWARRIKISLLESAINEAAGNFLYSIEGPMRRISQLEVFKKSKDEVLSMLSLTDEFNAVKKFLLLIDDKFQPRSYEDKVKERHWGTPKRVEFSTVKNPEEVIQFLETKLEGDLQAYKNAFDKILLRELGEYCRFESLWEGKEFKSVFIKYADKINRGLTWEEFEPLSLTPWSATLAAVPVSKPQRNGSPAPTSEQKDEPRNTLSLLP